jgi:RNA polymerase sigma-70 factor, ECF subfamily
MDRKPPSVEAVLCTSRAGLPEQPDTDQSKIKSIPADERTFQYFYERTAPGLRSYLRIMSKNTAVADDLLQESYLRFLKSGVHNLNDYQMKAYLYKTATSVLRDHWKFENRDRRWQQCNASDRSSAGNPNLSTDINELFRNLDPCQQTLLWLAYVEGFQHREIAAMLKVKEKSVRVLLFRTRKQFAEMLTQEGLNPKEQS